MWPGAYSSSRGQAAVGPANLAEPQLLANDDSATFDGLLPFVDGDILRWQEPYWKRVTAYLRLAADHGITVLLYLIDGWTIGRSFVPRSIDQCRRYGGKIARRVADLPKIVWMSGGDYWYAYAAKDPARDTPTSTAASTPCSGR